MDGGLVFIMLFLCASALAFGIRYMSNKEKMAMIERGIDPGVVKPRQPAPTPFISLKFGLLLVGIGLGLLAALFTVRGVGMDEPDSVAVFFGFISLFGGLGLIVSYIIEKRWLDNQK